MFDIEINEKDPQKLVDIIASLVPTLPNVGTLQGSNASRVPACYYGQGKC